MLLTLTSASAGEVFTYIGYILLALVALMFMIVVHESGHYLAGKMLGFTIDEFGIGFGPPIVKKVNRKNGELFISNMFIAEYANKGYESHAEKRDRKLLLLRKEICEIISELSRRGSTLVAMKLFFNDRGRAKLEIGLGRGKKLYDKRETIKDRDWNRDKKRILINANH